MACCSTKCLLLFFLISAVPLAYIISLELSVPPTKVYHYHSSGFLRECAKWDDVGRRFILSFFDNGLGQVAVPGDKDEHLQRVVIGEEVQLVKDVDLAGNASLGLVIDRPRNRILVAVADVIRHRYNGLAAYDLSTWKRLFLTPLGVESENETSFADDVTVDPEGNAYVTDAMSSKIWKVGANGEFLSVIRSPLFKPKEWYKGLVGLNGIVYHPDGYLLVIHTFTGNLFKIDVTKGDEEIKLVKILKGSLVLGDGIELLSPSKLVVAGNPSGRLVETSDGWDTASVVAKFSGPMHRLATAATVKDGKAYLSHMFGFGYPKKHAIVEAVFST